VSTNPDSGVRVTTTNAYTEYSVPNGNGWEAAPTATGDLYVTVYENPNDGSGDKPRKLAEFSNIEAVYLNGECRLLSQAGTAKGL